MRDVGALISRFVAGALCAMVLSLAAYGAASARHSLPATPQFWDLNNDGDADSADSDRTWGQAGGDWNANKHARMKEATGEWRTDSDFDPAFAVDAGLRVYVDGRDSCAGRWEDVGRPYAFHCLAWTNRAGYQDLYDSAIYLDKFFHAWEYGTDPYDSADPRNSFRGVMTHELGHGVNLGHIYACNDRDRETMCATASGLQTFLWVSLSQDDKDAANRVYFPGEGYSF